jgi:hypothetical protein
MTTMVPTLPLGRRAFGSLLLATAGAVVVRPGFGLGATDDPPAPLRTVNVRTSTQLSSALSNAWPGDHIVLANGTYSGSRTLSRAGTAAAPIVIRAAAKHSATLTGTLTLAAPFTIAYGLRFTGDSLGVQFAADDTAVLRCWFMGPRGVRGTTQKRTRIGYNRFTGGPVSGLNEGHQVYFAIPGGDSSLLPAGGKVYRNDMTSPSGSGASGEYMHVYIGPGGGRENNPSFGDGDADFRIEFNKISDSVHRRGIYTKRAGSILFNHVTGKGPGVTGIRHGSGGAFSGNRCENIDNVIINGPDHEVKGNIIRSRQGLILESERRTSNDILRYNAAHRALLVGNDANLVTVGHIESGDTLVAPVDGVRIYNHVGSVVLRQQTNTVWEQAPRPDMSAPTPITLSPRQVGPDAP